jgi:hypothetical protein
MEGGFDKSPRMSEHGHWGPKTLAWAAVDAFFSDYFEDIEYGQEMRRRPSIGPSGWG